MTEAEKIAADARTAAKYYECAPGHAGAATMVDLYKTIERLAREVSRQGKLLAHMIPDKSDDV